jgi:hypothetical protein
MSDKRKQQRMLSFSDSRLDSSTRYENCLKKLYKELCSNAVSCYTDIWLALRL